MKMLFGEGTAIRNGDKTAMLHVYVGAATLPENIGELPFCRINIFMTKRHFLQEYYAEIHTAKPGRVVSKPCQSRTRVVATYWQMVL